MEDISTLKQGNMILSCIPLRNHKHCTVFLKLVTNLYKDWMES